MSGKRDFAAYLPLLALFIILIRLPDVFSHYHDWDEAAMMSQAWAVTQGQVLYRDIFQIHPVLQLLLFVPFFLLFAPDAAPHAIKVFNIVLIFGSAAVVQRIALRWLAAPALSMIAALLFAACFRWDWAQSSHGEFYAILPILLAAYILLAAEKASRRGVFAAGLLLGIAFYLKQTSVFDAAVLGACALHRGRGGAKEAASDAAVLAAGFAAVTAGVSFYFLACGAWRTAMFSMWVRPALSYTGLGSAALPAGAAVEHMRIFRGVLHAAAYHFPLMLAAAAGGAAALLRRRLRGAAPGDEDRMFLYLWLWLAADVAGLVLVGRFYPHYLLQLIAPVALLSVFILRGLHLRPQVTLARVLLVLALGLSLRSAATALHGLSASGWKPPEVARSLAAAEYVRAHTRPEDRIFLYKCWNLDIFYLAGRLSNNGIYIFIDMVDEHMHDAEVEARKRGEFLAALPALVLVDPRGWLFPSAEKFFRGVLDERYERDATVSGIDVYRRKEPR